MFRAEQAVGQGSAEGVEMIDHLKLYGLENLKSTSFPLVPSVVFQSSPLVSSVVPASSPLVSSVVLIPCCSTGRTPPCSEPSACALIPRARLGTSQQRQGPPHMKTTLETSGEDVKLHSKRVEKM